jgi:hypothetical protein
MIEHEGWELVDGPYIQSAEKILEGAGRPDLSFLTDWL